jgi:enoyl-CoA hydratase/carnithine racemase
MERAAHLLLTGTKITGREAAAMGLVLRSVPADEVLPNAIEIARDIAENTAPLSVGITKKLLWQSPNLTAEQVEYMETELHHHLMGKPDAIEGVLAFMERRAPRWSQTVSGDWPGWPSPPRIDSKDDR